MRTSVLVCTGLLLSVKTLLAEPIVLGREQAVISSESYRHYFKQSLAKSNQSVDTVKRQRRPDAEKFLFNDRFLPVHSPSLTPGTVSDVQRIEVAGKQPLCLVGADSMSIDWLNRVKPRLLEVQARCLIIEVASQSELDVLSEALNPVPWMLASGEFLAQEHGLRHYPVLISRHGIEQ